MTDWPTLASRVGQNGARSAAESFGDIWGISAIFPELPAEKREILVQLFGEVWRSGMRAVLEHLDASMCEGGLRFSRKEGSLPCRPFNTDLCHDVSARCSGNAWPDEPARAPEKSADIRIAETLK